MTATTVYYVMVATLPITQKKVYWGGYSPQFPDMTGAYSGFPGQLTGIAVSYEVTPDSDTDINIPIGPAAGDLGGNYPNPIVVGIDGYAIQVPTNPVANDTLVFASDGYWTVAPAPTIITGNGIPFVNTIAALRTTIPAGSYAAVFAQSASAIGDNGGDLFVWNSASTATDNGSTVIKVSNIATGRWIRSEQGSLKIEWFAPSTSDLGIAVQAAHNFLDGYHGGIIDCTGLKGAYTFATEVTINRPVHIYIDGITITSTVANMFNISDNFMMSGKDVYGTIINLANDGYVCNFVAPYNHLPYFEPTYATTQFLLENIYFYGGYSALNTHNFTTGLEGNLNIRDCTFNSMTDYALYINNSWFYSRVERCLFEFCRGSANVQSYTETLFRDNIHNVASNGSSSIQLNNSNFVTFDNDRFYGFVPNTNPDILITVNDTFAWTAGWIAVKNCQFRAEREEWLNQTRTRILMTSNTVSSTVNGLVNLLITQSSFLGPGLIQIAEIGRSSGVVTATLNCDWPAGHGLQIGDVIQVCDTMTDTSFLGTFTVTAVGTPGLAQTVTWNQAGGDSGQSNKQGYILSQEMAAIRVQAPLGRMIVTDNNFYAYSYAIDDSANIPLNESAQGVTRDYMDRSVFANNTCVGQLGYNSQEFKLGGRFFAKLDAGEDSALASFNGNPNNKETAAGLMNRLPKSEDPAAWEIQGGCSVTGSFADPWGTTRASYIQRTGEYTFCEQNGSVQEGIVLSFDVTKTLPVQSYFKFWARGTATTSLCSIIVSALINSAGQLVIFRTVNVSQNWKQYKIPIVWPPGSITSAYVAYAPGDVDAMVADGYVCAFQVCDQDSDYILTTSAGAVYDGYYGSMYQLPVAFQSGQVVGGGYASIAIPDPSNLFLTEKQTTNAIINITGALTAQRDVIWPSSYLPLWTSFAGRSWIVINATTDGYQIECAGDTGSGVLIAAGHSAVVYSDGTNFYSVG